MAKISNDGVVLAKVMKDHMNTWPDKPTTFVLEDLGKDTPSLMIQQLSAAEVKKSYINGSYIGVWSFAVYMRISAKDTASRLDALGTLENLDEWLEAKDENGNLLNLPIIDDSRTATGIDMPTTPSVAAKYDDGDEDYQAIFNLEYKFSPRR